MDDVKLEPGSAAGSNATYSADAAPAFADARLRREWRTLVAMVRIYCRAKHRTAPEECSECAGLLAYARQRLDRCRFGVEKPTCAKCPVHCYKPERREQVRQVMRFAGPQMLWRHPILAGAHWLDSLLRRPATFSQE